jgi:hypothetical protein
MTSDEIQAAIRAAGFAQDYVTLWPGGSKVRVDYMEPMTFEKLDRLSKALGTTRIDLGIDRGCASDPSTDPYLIAYLPGTGAAESDVDK